MMGLSHPSQCDSPKWSTKIDVGKKHTPFLDHLPWGNPRFSTSQPFPQAIPPDVGSPNPRKNTGRTCSGAVQPRGGNLRRWVPQNGWFFFQGKSHLEMNDFGYPHLWKPRHGRKGETRTGETQSKLRDAQNDKSN